MARIPAASAASTEQSPKTLHEAAKPGKAAQLEAKISSLEARLHKERHEFSKMGQNNYRVFQVETEESSIIGAVSANGDVNNDGFNDMVAIRDARIAYFNAAFILSYKRNYLYDKSGVTA